jgi:hypothetical protein
VDRPAQATREAVRRWRRRSSRAACPGRGRCDSPRAFREARRRGSRRRTLIQSNLSTTSAPLVDGELSPGFADNRRGTRCSNVRPVAKAEGLIGLQFRGPVIAAGLIAPPLFIEGCPGRRLPGPFDRRHLQPPHRAVQKHRPLESDERGHLSRDQPVALVGRLLADQ